MGLDSGLEQLAVFGGEVGGGLPDKIGDLTVGRQLLQRGGIYVGAEGQAVVGTCLAGPCAGRLVDVAVFQDVC
jgi:hypothetical protein